MWKWDLGAKNKRNMPIHTVKLSTDSISGLKLREHHPIKLKSTGCPKKVTIGPPKPQLDKLEF